jgi:class 3 adenylate cyclase/tetratricopeptide (TPR) repeat protein
MIVCPSCGKENPEGFTFCGFCSAPLMAAELSREVRKTVTIVFCDVTGSTAMGEKLDPEIVRRVMGRYFSEMKTVLESHGGTVEKFIGDAVMAVFGIPQVHEDDALRAVRAASEMRERLRDLNKELGRDFGVTISSRIGVSTGEVVSGSASQTLATGDAVNVAARLEQAAHPGEILIGQDTLRLVRDTVVAEPVEPLGLKGKAEPVGAFRLMSVGGAEGFARRFDAPMVGGADELQALRDASRRAARDSACVLVTVLAPAGVGKSRLIQEFLERQSVGASVIRGRCLPYGTGITYWPVVEMLTASAGIDDLDGPDQVRGKIASLLEDVADAGVVGERLAHFLGLAGATAAPDETFWAVRKLFESRAIRSPLVAVFDDIHSAEPALLDLIEYVADWSRDAPILLVCLARPELLDERPGWGGGKPNATSLLLEPLTEAECDEVIANLLDRAELPQDARRKITEASEGNPLFVEQMVEMLIDDGVLRREDGSWVVSGDFSDLAVPGSITTLLEARLDRLPHMGRAVIERASVEGKVFHLGSVTALTPESERGYLREPLMALVRRDLISPDRSLFAGDDAFRFRHMLIRDAAYRRIPKERRAELHQLHADWLERAAGDRTSEFEEIIGYHMEQAYRLRSELGPLDERARDLAFQAADRLAASGMRARQRGDVGACAKLLERAASLYPVEAPARLELLPDLADALHESGEIARAEALIEDALLAARATGDRSVECRAVVSREYLRAKTNPPGFLQEDSLSEVAGLIPVLEGLGDARGLARAWIYVAESHWWLGRTGSAHLALDKAIQYARAAGEPPLARDALALYAASYMMSSTPISVATGNVEAIRDRAEGDRTILAFCSAPLALFAAMEGRFEDAHSHLALARSTLEELGMAVWSESLRMEEGEIELMAGDPIAAERVLRPGYEALIALGDRGSFSSLAGWLALAMARQSRDKEAEDVAAEARDATSLDDFATQILWREALAEVRVHQGRLDEAENLAREAVTIARRTDSSDDQGAAFATLGSVLAAARKRPEAIAAAREALTLYMARENLVGAERTRAFLRNIGVQED